MRRLTDEKWVVLGLAIVSEVAATLALRAALDHPAWFVVVFVGYSVAFYGLSRVLQLGLPLGVAYGIWCAAGVALTAVLAVPLYGDPFGVLMGVGVAILVVGVLLVELGHQKAVAARDNRVVGGAE